MEYNHFYIPDITSMVDIQEDYLNWFLSKAQIVSVAARLIINFKYLYKILKCLLLLRFGESGITLSFTGTWHELK